MSSSFAHMLVNHSTVSSCSSTVARYPSERTESTFVIALLLPLVSGNDQCGVGGLDPRREVSRAAPPGTFDPVAGASFVDAEAAVDPLEPPVSRAEQGTGPVFGGRVSLVVDRGSLHRVGVGGLVRHGEADGALVRKDPDVVSLAERGVGNPECGSGPLVLIGRIHEQNGQGFGHGRPRRGSADCDGAVAQVGAG